MRQWEIKEEQDLEGGTRLHCKLLLQEDRVLCGRLNGVIEKFIAEICGKYYIDE
jgi:hypothetical protein